MTFVMTNSFAIDDREVMRLLGGQQVKLKAEGRLADLISGAKIRAQELLEPRAVYQFYPARRFPGEHAFKGTEVVGLAVCTIGPRLESRVSRLFKKGDWALATVLDAIGSHATESAANYVNYLICKEARRQGLEPGPRFSPGYTPWPIEGQKLIFNVLETTQVGVKLNSSLMMVPRKSVSFAVGLALNHSREARTRRCLRCGYPNCAFRRK